MENNYQNSGDIKYQGYKEIETIIEDFEKKIKELESQEQISGRGRKKNSPNLSREQLKLIWELSKKEYLRPEIARKVSELHSKTNNGSSCSRQTVYNWQKKFGLI